MLYATGLHRGTLSTLWWGRSDAIKYETASTALLLQVEAPIEKVYNIWANRLNYAEWFDLVGQVSTGACPALTLYQTPCRSPHSSHAGCSCLQIGQSVVG